MAHVRPLHILFSLGAVIVLLSGEACSPGPVPLAVDERLPAPHRWEMQRPRPDRYAQDPSALESTLRTADVAARMEAWPAYDPPVADGLIEFRPVELVPAREGTSHELAIETAIHLGESPGTSRRLWIRRLHRDRVEPWRGPFVMTAEGEVVLTGR